MTSGSEVRATSYNKLNTNVIKYKSSISGLSASWKEVSHDGLTPKATKKIEKYMEILKGSFDQFATACDKYEQYEKKKKINLLYMVMQHQ